MQPTNPERKASGLDRAHLIQRLKRENSPSWQHYQRPAEQDRPETPVRAPIQIRNPQPSPPDPLRDNATAGSEIARPRSALHSGDFREKRDREQYKEGLSSQVPLATSPVVPWHKSFPAAAARPPAGSESSYAFHDTRNYDSRPATRSRATSQLSFPSFAFMPPTSPLVHQSNNTDLDFSSRPSSRQTSTSPDRSSRRHTFSPQSFDTCQSAAMARSASGTPAARHIRNGGTIPYQAHQPRRSLTSLNQFQPHSSPQSPFLGAQRPSFSEASPLHHAPMVGSYEESILRGRMSTTPSRPLNFIAKIGVLGRGQCRSNLKCPPHVAVPFPAVFYSYRSGNGRFSDDSPSPYVGLIDLENSLPAPDEGGESGKKKRRQTLPTPDQDGFDLRPEGEEYGSRYRSNEGTRRKEKRKRRSTSPRAPPGGSYRIPQVGQLQIVIKNPNKTAVKLFLVPYDLSDMEPGQKTFVRQRSYSAGPIIDMPMSSRKNFGTDRPEAALSHSDDPNDRPILRYLIHLHICCPSKGRYYLYKSIRVVFANRVPDGKEKLQNEIQLPEPRYSTYRASRDSLASQAPSSAATQLANEKALHRRSAGVSLSQQSFDQIDGVSSRTHPSLPPPAMTFTGGPTSHSSGFSTPLPALEPIPFSLTQQMPSTASYPVSREMDIDPDSPFRSRMGDESSSAMDIGSPNRNSPSNVTAFEKLGRDAFCGVTASGAGLLAKRLRGLDVQREDRDPSRDAGSSA
ncbi:hypothetical protein P280DRAFT_402451 [Massarina eburnea CBS 473.64]|uniref:Atos-like conserved domain-containing protein n=1 Tax=Massarina eburnea CBS 473.64 TaxID=1395130 RepID=A0A6A6RVF0_9PLEO|nr:hypothetical protein P280DRAFT_402451 [Massarina eburnea CBS 473.64]